jgi:hypothetical protein
VDTQQQQKLPASNPQIGLHALLRPQQKSVSKIVSAV